MVCDVCHQIPSVKEVSALDPTIEDRYGISVCIAIRRRTDTQIFLRGRRRAKGDLLLLQRRESAACGTEVRHMMGVSETSKGDR